MAANSNLPTDDYGAIQNLYACCNLCGDAGLAGRC
jgi:hypothetical protein